VKGNRPGVFSCEACPSDKRAGFPATEFDSRLANSSITHPKVYFFLPIPVLGALFV
jgi:hypothetical protein